MYCKYFKQKNFYVKFSFINTASHNRCFIFKYLQSEVPTEIAVREYYDFFLQFHKLYKVTVNNKNITKSKSLFTNSVENRK